MSNGISSDKASGITVSILLESNSLDSVLSLLLLFSVILESNIRTNNREASAQVLLSRKSVVFLTPPIC